MDDGTLVIVRNIIITLAFYAMGYAIGRLHGRTYRGP